MGLGHMRAAHALKDIAGGEILMDGSEELCRPEEYKIWKEIRQTYYFLSKAEKMPFAGKLLLKLLNAIEDIPSYYPRRDLSTPTWTTRYLAYMIKKHGLCSSIVGRIEGSDLPMINTFYATAVALDNLEKKAKDNYLLICDSDFNRVWVSENPKKSAIKYLAPCTRVKRRLVSYGVPEERIFVTGFPLPKENIGGREKLEILKDDLFNRLLRLDPNRNYFNIHEKTVEYYLEKKVPQKAPEKHFTLMFAVGGAGGQANLVKDILKSLKKRIRNGEIKLVISAGIMREVLLEIERYAVAAGLKNEIGNGVRIVFDEDVYRYFDKFNLALRETDVLWTKPSELSFYCALGIPILMAPTIGTHEEQNRMWLQEIHTGVKPAGSVDTAHEWLFDLRNTGVLAEAAWDGFLKARKLGTYRIEELVTEGRISTGNSPLER